MDIDCISPLVTYFVCFLLLFSFFMFCSSDFMDKYLDMHSNDAVDTHYLTTTVAAEAKKDNY